MAIHSLYGSGNEIFDFDSYQDEVVILAKYYPDNLLISAVTHQLNIDYEIEEISKVFDGQYLDANLNAWDDLMFMWGMGGRGRDYKSFIGSWQTKSIAMKSEKRVYEFSKRFTDAENSLMSLCFPDLIEASTIYNRYFRISRAQRYYKKTQRLNEEGLDLID